MKFEKALKGFCFLIVLAIIFLSGSVVYFRVNHDKPTQKVSYQETTAEWNQRKQIASSSIQGIKRIIELTNNQDVRELLAFLENQTFLAMPDPNQKQLYVYDSNSRPRSAQIALIPFIDGDQNQVGFWQQIGQMKNAYAFFMFKPTPMIIVRSSTSRGNLLKGIQLLHELHHAREWLNENQGNETINEQYCINELRAHEFGILLMSDIGGDQYLLLVKELTPWFWQQLNNPNPSRVFATDPGLNKFWPESLTGQEKKEVLEIFWLGVLFNAIDTYGDRQSNLEAIKADYLCGAYKRNGLVAP
jgi:hypothetical protein